MALTSRPRRAGRPVHRFEGLDFGFMATQPFVTFAGGTEGTFTYAAVDPQGLARAVPTLAQFGLRPLAQGAPPLAARRPDATLRPFTPPRTTAHHPDGDAYVYDLILALGDGRSEFFAGDTKTQLLVSSEIPRYLAAPQAAGVVLHVLEQVTGPILHRMAEVPDEGFADLLSIGLDGAARTLLPRLAPGVTSYEAAVLAEGDSALAEAVTRLSASLGQGGAYDQRAATLVEQFIPRFAPQFQAAIRLGWRSFNLAAPGSANALAISVYAIELLAGSTLIEAADADIAVTLAIGGSAWSRTLGVDRAASTDHAYFTSDRVAYFPEWRPVLEQAAESSRTGDLWELRLALRRCSTGETLPGCAVLSLPPQIADGYQAYCVPLRDAEGQIVGQVAFDLRALGSDGLREDIEQRAAWSPTEEPAAASRLAAAAAAALPGAFELAVVAFHSGAVTPEGQLAGAAMAAANAASLPAP